MSQHKTYYKIEVKNPNNNTSISKKYDGELSYEDVKPFLSTHTVPGYWSFGPHDWGECNVEVNIIKITEEKI